MIEVQIRRPCSQQKEFLGLCPECFRWTFGKKPLKHVLVTEWVPLEKAIQMAHEEATRDALRNKKRV